jgi:hypothetical protein
MTHIEIILICLCLFALAIKQTTNRRILMSSIERLNAAAATQTALTTAIVAALTTPHATDAQVDAASAVIEANNKRVNDVLNPPAETVTAAGS